MTVAQNQKKEKVLGVWVNTQKVNYIKDFIKSMLFVPAHKENFLNKLDKLTSDAVVIDLEDAKHLEEWICAWDREKINKSKFSKNLFVRINNDPKNLLPDIILST